MRSASAACQVTSQSTVDRRPHLVALGIVSAPANDGRRRWLRSTHRAFAVRLRHNILPRFIFGTTELEPSRCDQLLQEADDHFFVNAYDNPQVGCVDKTFAWFAAALRVFPATAFIAKCDDDSMTHLWNLEALGLQMKHASFIYAGWIQYTSFRPQTFQQCGWSLRADHASPCSKTSQLNAEGPFPFATGALEMLSRPLADHVFSSSWTNSFVAHARAVARGGHANPWESWTCAHEDATLGYVIRSSTVPSRVAIKLVLLNSWMNDIGRAAQRPYEGFVILHRWDLVGPPLRVGNRTNRLRAMLNEVGNGTLGASSPPLGQLALFCLNRSRASRRQTVAILHMPGCANWQVCTFASKSHALPWWLRGSYTEFP